MGSFVISRWRREADLGEVAAAAPGRVEVASAAATLAELFEVDAPEADLSEAHSEDNAPAAPVPPAAPRGWAPWECTRCGGKYYIHAVTPQHPGGTFACDFCNGTEFAWQEQEFWHLST